ASPEAISSSITYCWASASQVIPPELSGSCSGEPQAASVTVSAAARGTACRRIICPRIILEFCPCRAAVSADQRAAVGGTVTVHAHSSEPDSRPVKPAQCEELQQSCNATEAGSEHRSPAGEGGPGRQGRRSVGGLT